MTPYVPIKKIGRAHVFTSLAIMLASRPGVAAAQVAGANPPGSGPILAAMTWMQGTLLGNVATTAAVIAVATVGLLMLTGRINWRFGATVIIGCFVLFGATAIVSGIRVAAAVG
ncbi:MAG: TrbC/VirB2 family protein [Sphingomonas sp.]|jgi:type IV secretion system protein VirB2